MQNRTHSCSSPHSLRPPPPAQVWIITTDLQHKLLFRAREGCSRHQAAEDHTHFFLSSPLCGLGLNLLARRRRLGIDRLFSQEIADKILGLKSWTDTDRNPGRLCDALGKAKQLWRANLSPPLPGPQRCVAMETARSSPGGTDKSSLMMDSVWGRPLLKLEDSRSRG